MLAAKGQRAWPMARRFALQNGLLILFATLTIIGFNLTLLQSQLIDQERTKALRTVATLAEFSALYLNELRINEMQIALAEVKRSPQVLEAAVVARDGKVIADGTSEFEQALTDRSADPAIVQALAAREQIIIQDATSLTVAQPIIFSSQDIGAIRLVFSLDELNQNLNAARTTSAILVIGFLALGFLISHWWSKRVTKPLVGLTQSIQTLATGNMQLSVEETGARELRALANSFNSMVDSLREKDQRITRLAYFDTLTDVPNRRRMQDVVEQLLEHYDDLPWADHADELEQVSLLMIDLDRFKQVNDTFGHPVGDDLLIAVCERICAIIEQNEAWPVESTIPLNVMARLGGDEMVVLLSNKTAEDVVAVGNRIVEELCRPFTLDGNHVEIGASIGVAYWPRQVDDRAGLMRASDLAVYRAKRNGRGQVQVYDPVIDEVGDQPPIEREGDPVIA